MTGTVNEMSGTEKSNSLTKTLFVEDFFCSKLVK